MKAEECPFTHYGNTPDCIGVGTSRPDVSCESAPKKTSPPRAAPPVRVLCPRGTPALMYVLAALLGVCTAVPVRAQVTTGTPTEFFTNLASRLVRDQFGLDLTNLQIFPTNYYSPALHRLLQVTSNLYDSTTNRNYAPNTPEPYCPTVFRPLFRRTTDGGVLIAGYREVEGTLIANPVLGPPILDLDDTNSLAQIPPVGTPFTSVDREEPMVVGIPLVIGARKGFPSFNEFAMQTAIYVSRLLEFRRAAGSSTGPVVETNQMYVAAITNAFGFEAWNSYSNPYPRNLRLSAAAQMTAIMTNETGIMLLSNSVTRGTNFDIGPGTWPGWHSPADLAASFQLPFGSTNWFMFLPSSSYVTQPPAFIPQTHVFELHSTLAVPHWHLNLQTRLLFILVDPDANRVVDYVNLKWKEPPIDIIGELANGADCSGAFPSAPQAQWCTNLSTQGSPLGVLNQIAVGLGLSGSQLPDINAYSQDPYAGLDAESAVDGFRYNLMGWSPIYPKDVGRTFYRSNVFYVPFDPYRPLYLYTSIRANDPLVHYTFGDLIDLILSTNRLGFASHNPPLDNLGYINQRYQPWGGNPAGSSNPSFSPVDLAVKDPVVTRADAWDFPTNQPLAMNWVGRVHRGTPWQTIYLKSTNFLARGGGIVQLNENFRKWQQWTGNPYVYLSPGSAVPIADAFFTIPTNDWHLVSLLASLWNTNDVRTLASPNETSAAAWTSLLDGITVLTNVSYSETDTLVMSSNSPQAALIADSMLATRAGLPGGVFTEPGQVLAVPQLSLASPWLNNSVQASDEAFESIPSQLLARLRYDSAGSIQQAGVQPQVEFSGYDGYPYAVQVSSNLVDWAAVSTNVPQQGYFTFPDNAPVDASARFYRSLLLP